MVKIDLHMHSTASDGKLSPKEIVDYAINKKIPIISITDHDRVDGSREAITYSKGKNIRVIPGIEITADQENYGADLHIVGLFISYLSESFDKLIEQKKIDSRIVANKMIKKLNDFNFDISIEELDKFTNKKNYGRPHIANLLLSKYPERFVDRKQIFNEFLGNGKKAHIPPIASSLEEVIKFIHSQKGIAILAHPWYFKEKMFEVLNRFVLAGGDGIEVACKDKKEISENTEKILREFVKKNNLVASGGTDFHESKEGGLDIGDRGLNLKEFEKLEKFYTSKFTKKHLNT